MTPSTVPFLDAFRSTRMQVTPTRRNTYALEMTFNVASMSRADLDYGASAVLRAAGNDVRLTVHDGRCRLNLRESAHESELQSLARSPVFRDQIIRAIQSGIEINEEDRWSFVRAVVNSPTRTIEGYGESPGRFANMLKGVVSAQGAHALLGASVGALLLAVGATHAIKHDVLHRAMGSPMESSYVKFVTTLHAHKIRNEIDDIVAMGADSREIDGRIRHLTAEADRAVNRAIRGVELINAESYNLPMARSMVREATPGDREAVSEVIQWMSGGNDHEDMPGIKKMASLPSL